MSEPIAVTEKLLHGILKHRANDSHKGNYGHLLLVCGCRTMPGAAVLATGASLQSGCGLVTLHTSYSAASAAVANFPSAMISEDPAESFSIVPNNLSKYSAIGCGPGLGKSENTVAALKALLSKAKELQIPMLLDADALNIISEHPDFLELIPSGSLMTPHLGELKRLITWSSDEEKDDAIFALCRKTGCVIVSKGFHTRIYTPEGTVYVNPTGNPGMAKGGSGDVLTGLCSGLIARGYDARDAALLGVWIHGYAGDCLSAERTQEAYSSLDMIGSIFKGFTQLYTLNQRM